MTRWLMPFLALSRNGPANKAWRRSTVRWALPIWITRVCWSRVSIRSVRWLQFIIIPITPSKWSVSDTERIKIGMNLRSIYRMAFPRSICVSARSWRRNTDWRCWSSRTLRRLCLTPVRYSIHWMRLSLPCMVSRNWPRSRSIIISICISLCCVMIW